MKIAFFETTPKEKAFFSERVSLQILKFLFPC